MKYKIQKREEETECSYCAFPLYIGDSVLYREEKPYCSEKCANLHKAIQAEKGARKLIIRTGSSSDDEAYNKKQFRLLNTWLFSESNPHRDLFEQEVLCLDSTNSFVSVIPLWKYRLRKEELAKVAKAIASKVAFESKSYIYVDDYILEVQ